MRWSYMRVRGDTGVVKYECVTLSLGFAFAFGMLVAGSLENKVDYGDAANLGATTTTMMAAYEGHPIHCHGLDDSERCIKGVQLRGLSSAVLWLGNSQIHAVNQAVENDTTAVPYLFESMKKRGFDLVVFSQPNANLQEHWILFEYLLPRIPIGKLILPVVFDDTREEGLRKEVADALVDDGTISRIVQHDLGVKLLNAAKLKGSPKLAFDTFSDTMIHVTPEVSMQDKQATGSLFSLIKLDNLFRYTEEPTIGAKIEDKVNSVLESHFVLWRMRPDMRAEIILGYLYRARNVVFNITANSERRLIKGRYRDNLEAFRLILDSARRAGVQVYVYIAPIRNDVPIPYNNAEYTAFKIEIENITRRSNHTFVNYESLIPAHFWGQKQSTGVGGVEVDFMHFQAAGHQMLAESLSELVR